MRPLLLACCLAALALAGCGEDDEPAAPAPAGIADLTVTVDRDGDGGGAPQARQVTCAAAADCPALARLAPEDLAPVPRATACTQQFGGPETATVKGTLHGEAVDARFSKANGCEISRWRAAAPLLG